MQSLNVASRNFAILLTFLTALSGLLASCSAQVDRQLGVGDPAPNFSAAAADGKPISLADYQDQQPVLLFFHMALG